MTGNVIVVIALVAFVAPVLGQSKAPIQGVWQTEEAAFTGGSNPRAIKNHPPDIYIFTDRHYSSIGVRTPNGEPRPNFEAAKVPGKLTDAEKLARYEQWAPFGAASGIYEVKGNTLTLRSIVAKNETAMSGKPDPQRAEFKVDGNTLWLTFTAVNGKSQTRLRLTRLE